MSKRNTEDQDAYLSIDDEEPIRKCAYCGEEKKSRGLHAHVMNTNGNGHGSYRKVPDGFKASDAEIVGYENIDKRETVSDTKSGKELILCRICGDSSKGMHGFNIHVKKMAGKENHPEDPTEITKENYRAIPTDEHWRPVDTATDRELADEYSEVTDWDDKNTDSESENTQPGMFVPIEEMNKIRDILITSREKQPVIDEFERIMERYS